MRLDIDLTDGTDQPTEDNKPISISGDAPEVQLEDVVGAVNFGNDVITVGDIASDVDGDVKEGTVLYKHSDGTYSPAPADLVAALSPIIEHLTDAGNEVAVSIDEGDSAPIDVLVDGEQLVNGPSLRVLVIGQPDAAKNGVYDVKLSDWSPSTSYRKGDKVLFDGKEIEILSSSDDGEVKAGPDYPDPVDEILSNRRSDLTYCYVRPTNSRKGGLTIAFVVPKVPSNMVTVSLAWCHPNDVFVKAKGRTLAEQIYVRNEVSMIRLIRKGNYSAQLIDLFEPLVEEMV